MTCQTISLCMIVKNEARVIGRCLESVLPFITSWSICDTGSTDGTQQIVRGHMRSLPGQLHERPWVDQQHNRNESIELARSKADYLLLLDADETLETDDGFELPALTEDCYDFVVRMDGTDCEFARPILVSARFPWEWRGKRHPGLYGEGARNPGVLPGIYVRSRTDGASWSDPEKYRRHVAEMEAAVAENPGNARTRYYLAQSYRAAGMAGKAIEAYLQRADMGGWAEEAWSASYEAAKLLEACGCDTDHVMRAYLAAYMARPTRAEPLYRLAKYLRQHGHAHAALMYAREAARMQRPPDRLFVEASVYAWRAIDELSMCAHACGDFVLAVESARLLQRRAPGAEQARVEKNLGYFTAGQ